jgi:hypothetical protein
LFQGNHSHVKRIICTKYKQQSNTLSGVIMETRDDRCNNWKKRNGSISETSSYKSSRFTFINEFSSRMKGRECQRNEECDRRIVADYDRAFTSVLFKISSLRHHGNSPRARSAAQLSPRSLRTRLSFANRMHVPLILDGFARPREPKCSRLDCNYRQDLNVASEARTSAECACTKRFSGLA